MISDSQRGLYLKYHITKRDGSECDPDAEYFVLRVDKDPHAQKAVAAYAASVNDENEKFAEDLLHWCLRVNGKFSTEMISDGYHTFKDLYQYRQAYNALLFNAWAEAGIYDVHKSMKHSDGEDCFGGGWFIVVAQLPTGQISNHYPMKYWEEFRIPVRDMPDQWDGHTPQQALDRMKEMLKQEGGE